MNDVVIARYKEDLDWVLEIPGDFNVFIYNKGDEIRSPAIKRRAKVISRKNVGRESETYLWHMKHALGVGSHTVFCQGDPFEHSPDFMEHLANARTWSDVQPLSWQWKTERNIPPRDLLTNYRSQNPAGPRLRPEYFSLVTWNPVHFYDEGAFGISFVYRSLHALPEGANIAAHFLEMAMMSDASREAARHVIGTFSYGAIFAVKNERVRAVQPQSIAMLHNATLNHGVYGYIMERMWLHLFGQPFLQPEL